MDEAVHDDDEDLRKAMALSLQVGETVVPARRQEEEEELQVAMELSRQTSGGPASPSAVQVRLSQSKLAAVPTAGSHTAASMRVEQARHLAPMRSGSVSVPDVSDLPMVYPSPLGRTASGATALTTGPRVSVKPPTAFSHLRVWQVRLSATGLAAGSEDTLWNVELEAAAVSACLAGTWTDWSVWGDPAEAEYCTIQPLEGQVLFGVHTFCWTKKMGDQSNTLFRQLRAASRW